MSAKNTNNKGLSIYSYIAKNGKQKEINGYLNAFGLPPASNRQDAENKLKIATLNYGDEAVNKLSMIHPDKELLNCNGYMNCDGCKYKNAEGNPETAEPTETSVKMGSQIKGFVKENQTLVISVIAIIAIMTIAKK